MNGRIPLFSRRLSVLGVVVVALFCQACDPAEKAVKLALGLFLEEMEKPPDGWRVHRIKTIPAGSRVSSFDFRKAGNTEAYTCRGVCDLFFVDFEPSAHFVHPTLILVYDHDPPEGQLPLHVMKKPTKWWPTVQLPGQSTPRSFFNTVAKRSDPSTVIVLGLPGELVGIVDPFPFLARGTLTKRTNTPTPWDPTHPMPTPTPQPTVTAELPVWAILVNGYDDVSDTFDDDIVGMYSVLNGFGLSNDRVSCLSPFDLGLPSKCAPASVDNLEVAFVAVGNQMEDHRREHPAGPAPHFLLFWSSHGSGERLACNLADGRQESVKAKDLAILISNLEAIWEPDDNTSTRLETTIVIEACESGAVGKRLFETDGAHRRILTSAEGRGDSSYRDTDYTIGDYEDPNPADSGSETIWGYVEAFGTASADDNKDGKIDFNEAVEYAKKSDVTLKRIVGTNTEETGKHRIGLWVPTTTGSIPVHGAGATSTGVRTSIVFNQPESAATLSMNDPRKVKVVRGEPVEFQVEIESAGGENEVGALALRLFRRDESGSADQWRPKYYSKKDLGVTIMIPGIAAFDSTIMDYVWEAESALADVNEMRIVATLDSGQSLAQEQQTVGANPEDSRSAILLEVVDGAADQSEAGPQ